MSDFLSNFKWMFRRRSLLIPNIFSILLICVNFAGLIFTIPPTNEPVFLHYTIYFGIDLIGNWIWLFLMPASGALIFFINLTLSIILYRNHLLLVYFLTLSSTLANIVLLVSSGLMILQNIT